MTSLLSQLSSPHEPERLAALRVLVRNPEADSAGELVRLFSDPMPRVRELAVDALSALGATALPVVVPFLESPDPAIRALALQVAQASGEKGFLYLLPLLSSPDKDLRRFGLEAIATLPLAVAEDYLLAGTYDTDPNVRIAAVEGLGKRKSARAIPRLVAMLDDDSVYMLHLAVIHVLASLGATEALARIIELARRSPFYLMPALDAWGALGQEDSLPVAHALAMLQGGEAYGALLRAASRLLSRGESMSAASLDTLRPLAAGFPSRPELLPLLLRLQPERVHEVLPRRIHDESLPEETEELLAQQPDLLAPAVGEDAVLALLLRLAEENRLSLPLPERLRDGLVALPLDDPHQAFLVARVMECCAEPAFGDRLFELTRHADPMIAACALRALGRLRDPRAVALAFEAFLLPEPDRWHAAGEALAALQDPDAVPRLEALVIQHRGSERGLCALGALASLGHVSPRFVEEFLAHPEAGIRRQAAIIGLKAGGLPPDMLASLVNDPDAGLRFVTLRHLARVKGEVSLELLAYALQNEPDAENRREVLSALLAWQSPEADALVDEELASADRERAREAPDALLEVADADGLAVLERFAQRGNGLAEAALIERGKQ